MAHNNNSTSLRCPYPSVIFLFWQISKHMYTERAVQEKKQGRPPAPKRKRVETFFFCLHPPESVPYRSNQNNFMLIAPKLNALMICGTWCVTVFSVTGLWHFFFRATHARLSALTQHIPHTLSNCAPILQHITLLNNVLQTKMITDLARFYCLLLALYWPP